MTFSESHEDYNTLYNSVRCLIVVQVNSMTPCHGSHVPPGHWGVGWFKNLVEATQLLGFTCTRTHMRGFILRAHSFQVYFTHLQKCRTFPWQPGINRLTGIGDDGQIAGVALTAPQGILLGPQTTLKQCESFSLFTTAPPGLVPA